MNHPIPAAALSQHIAILGKTGSGKSYCAQGIAEELLTAGERVCIIDPTGRWWGLRSSASGKGTGFPVVVFGGAHADVPLAETHGETLAEIIGTSNTPAILDTRQMTVWARTRFFADFAEALLRKNKGPLTLIIDEAHLFAPQGRVNDPQSGKMLHAANNLVSLGRGVGLRIILITQRPAKLHKDSLTQAETLVALRLIAPQDRNAVQDWIGEWADPKEGKEVLSSLPSLPTGTGWIWAPELGVLKKATFPKIKTFDSGKAPTGEGEAGPVLASIDLPAIQARLGKVAEDAKANDPKALKAEVADLRRQLAMKDKATIQAAKADPAEIEKARQEGFAEGAAARLSEIRQAVTAAKEGIDRAGQAVLQLAAMIEQSPKPPARSKPSAPSEGVTGPQQRILDALAGLEGLGIEQPTRTQLALWADVSPTSGGYFNNLGALRTAGLIDYPAGGLVALTVEGRATAVPPPAMTEEEMQETLFRKVGNAKAAILRALIGVYPAAMTRDELADTVEVSRTSGGYFNNLGNLRTLGLIDYPTKGQVVALPILFIE